jgi:general stress protein 26
MESPTQRNAQQLPDGSEQPIRKRVDKIRDIKIAMLSTKSEDGRLHSRPGESATDRPAFSSG